VINAMITPARMAMASNNLSKRYQNLFIEDFFDVVSNPLSPLF
jgi:hypothetical protein